MQGREMVQELRQVDRGLRPEHQVPVIRHQRVCEQFRGPTHERSIDEPEKLVVVERTLEESTALVAPIHYVDNAPGSQRTMGTRHALGTSQSARQPPTGALKSGPSQNGV
jgi:hypothetical protein